MVPGPLSGDCFPYLGVPGDHVLMRSKSYVKWLGDKTKLTPAIRNRLPAKHEGYIEPFVGSGALFFETLPQCALLADLNERLIRTHLAVRDRPEEVIEMLGSYRNDKNFFNFMRARSKSIDAASDVEVAAWLIFLSKTAHSGLYRVNSKNQFNVPFGNYEARRFFDADKLRACSAALQGASIECASFETSMSRAQPGDFIYADPPYVKVTTTSFVGYTANGFGGEQHRRLRDLAIELRRRGVFVLISNSAAPAVRDLYGGKGFHVEEISVRRSIAVKGRHRGTVKELVISNYPPPYAQNLT